MPETTANLDTASVSPFLLLPLRLLTAFAAELRDRLNHLPAGAERASLARIILAAESEMALRRRRHQQRP